MESDSATDTLQCGANGRQNVVEAGRLCPGARPLGCLLIHGLTGGSHDLAPLASALSEAGFPIFLVQLPGHGTTPEDLATRSWEEWYDAAANGAEELAASGRGVAAIGLSLGSLLALELAYSRPRQVACVVALSTALHLRSPLLRLASPLLAGLGRAETWIPGLKAALGGIILPKGEPDIAVDRTRAQLPGYREIPLRALLQLSLLQRRVLARLPYIAQPTLVIHGAKDNTCPLSNASLLASRIGARLVKKIVLESSAHVLTMDAEQDKVAAAVSAFLTGVCDFGMGKGGDAT